jgi:hypothetical protein
MTHAVRWVGLAGGIGVVWVALLPPAPVAQPLAFNHARHGAVACAVCHSGVESSARAGIPSGAVCVKCHATAPAGVTSAAWDALGRGGRSPWIQVTRVPDHALFSHRRHVVLASLACASCHGDVGQQVAPPPRNPVRLTMDECLSCHKREGASEDCATCHR